MTEYLLIGIYFCLVNVRPFSCQRSQIFHTYNSTQEHSCGSPCPKFQSLLRHLYKKQKLAEPDLIQEVELSAFNPTRYQHGSIVTSINNIGVTARITITMSTNQSSRIARVNYITGVVLKKNDKRKLGISFVSKPEDRVVYIRKVKGQFRKHTNLVPCLKVLSINGKMVFTSMEAADIVRKTPHGQHVQVIAEGSCTELKKTSRFSSTRSLGISLEQVPQRKDLVRVAGVDEENHRLSGLEVGSILMSINGRSIRSVSQANLLLRINKSLTLVSVQCFNGGIAPKLTLEQQLLILNRQGHGDDTSLQPVVPPSELQALTRKRNDEKQRIILEQEEKRQLQQHPQQKRQQRQQVECKEEERLVKKQEKVMEAPSMLLQLPSEPEHDEAIAEEAHQQLQGKEQEEEPAVEHSFGIETLISIASSDASGLPDVILNLQAQDDLKDEALASLLGGPSEARPFLSLEEKEQELQGDDDDEDLRSFLTNETKEQDFFTFENEETFVGEIEDISTENLFSKSMNFFRTMEKEVIDTKKVGEEQKSSEEEEEQKGEEPAAEEQKGQGEEQKGELPAEEFPSLFVATFDDEDCAHQLAVASEPFEEKQGVDLVQEEEEVVVEVVAPHQQPLPTPPATVEQKAEDVPKHLPAQVHVHHIEEDLNSFLTEEKDEQFVVETLLNPKKSNKTAPRKVNDNRNKQTVRRQEEEEEEKGDDDTVVGETHYSSSDSIFTKGFKLFHAFVVDATSCEKASRRYNTYDDNYAI